MCQLPLQYSGVHRTCTDNITVWYNTESSEGHRRNRSTSPSCMNLSRPDKAQSKAIASKPEASARPSRMSAVRTRSQRERSMEPTRSMEPARGQHEANAKSARQREDNPKPERGPHEPVRGQHSLQIIDQIHL
jgi:hypothetical protein